MYSGRNVPTLFRLFYPEHGGSTLLQNFDTFLPDYMMPHTRVFPEKLTVPQLIKKFPAFYGTRRFITAFIRASLQYLS